jgi:hypothetical protein
MAATKTLVSPPDAPADHHLLECALSVPSASGALPNSASLRAA